MYLLEAAVLLLTVLGLVLVERVLDLGEGRLGPIEGRNVDLQRNARVR